VAGEAVLGLERFGRNDIVGAIADYGNRKKQCLAATAYLGAAAAMAMFWLQGSDYIVGGVLFIIANVSFGASVVIYNSFLPEIAPPEQRGRRGVAPRRG